MVEHAYDWHGRQRAISASHWLFPLIRSLPIPSVGDDFLFTLDRLVSLGTQGLLIPIVIR